VTSRRVREARRVTPRGAAALRPTLQASLGGATGGGQAIRACQGPQRRGEQDDQVLEKAAEADAPSHGQPPCWSSLLGFRPTLTSGHGVMHHPNWAKPRVQAVGEAVLPILAGPTPPQRLVVTWPSLKRALTARATISPKRARATGRSSLRGCRPPRRQARHPQSRSGRPRSSTFAHVVSFRDLPARCPRRRRASRPGRGGSALHRSGTRSVRRSSARPRCSVGPRPAIRRR
jgi:hypothetical protein